LNSEDKGRRKYLIVEMADWFEDVMLPRIKKVASCTDWKNGKPTNSSGVSQFIKYFQLEQYEDTLRKVKYEDSEFFADPDEEPYNQYVFLKDLKMLESLEVDQKNDKVKLDLSKLYKDIDVAETLSHVLGKWIKKITQDFVEFEDGERVRLKDLDYKLFKPLVWW